VPSAFRFGYYKFHKKTGIGAEIPMPAFFCEIYLIAYVFSSFSEGLFPTNLAKYRKFLKYISSITLLYSAFMTTKQ